MARATPLHRYYHSPVGLPSCVTPSLAYYQLGSRAPPTAPQVDQPASGGQHHWVQHGRSFAGTGISTRCPSTTPVGLALGPDSPWADEPAPGTLALPAGDFPTPPSLLIPAFSLPWRPRLGFSAASHPSPRSPTHPHTWPPTRGRRRVTA